MPNATRSTRAKGASRKSTVKPHPPADDTLERIERVEEMAAEIEGMLAEYVRRPNDRAGGTSVLTDLPPAEVERLTEHVDLAEAEADPNRDLEDRLAGLERQAERIAAKISLLAAQQASGAQASND